jgi:hypothetical protein
MPLNGGNCTHYSNGFVRKGSATSLQELSLSLDSNSALPALDLTVHEYLTIPTALSVDYLGRVLGHPGSCDALIADWTVSTGAGGAESDIVGAVRSN